MSRRRSYAFFINFGIGEKTYQKTDSSVDNFITSWFSYFLNATKEEFLKFSNGSSLDDAFNKLNSILKNEETKTAFLILTNEKVENIEQALIEIKEEIIKITGVDPDNYPKMDDSFLSLEALYVDMEEFYKDLFKEMNKN